MNYHDEIKKLYPDAGQILHMRRTKVKKPLAKVLDAVVGLFTPVPEITETADLISDLGVYYLVFLGGKELLVRLAKDGTEERDVTGLFDGKALVLEGNRFAKLVKIHG